MTLPSITLGGVTWERRRPRSYIASQACRLAALLPWRAATHLLHTLFGHASDPTRQFRPYGVWPAWRIPTTPRSPRAPPTRGHALPCRSAAARDRSTRRRWCAAADRQGSA